MSDRLDYFFRQKVTEAELDLGFNDLEVADRNQAIDWALFGINSGLVVQQATPTPNLTVRVTGPGIAYDQLGQRCEVPSTQSLDVSVDSSSVSTAVATPGNEKIVSVFLKFDRALSDPRTDGNSITVFFERDESFRFIVRQGAETGSPPATPPALEADAVLLADIRRTNPQTQILNADITPPGGTYTAISNRRQDAFVETAGSLTIRENTINDAIQAVLQELNDHLTGVSNAHPASAIDYGGGSAWLDGTTNPATSVEAQLDKIITDLISTTATNSGADRVGADAVAGSPSTLGAGSISSQLASLLSFVNARARIASNETITGTWTFDETILTSPSGGQTDPAWTDDREAGGGYHLLGEWRTVVASAIRVRMYVPIGLSGEVILFTRNLRYNGVSNNFVPDDSGSSQTLFRAGPFGMQCQSFSGAGPHDITGSGFDQRGGLFYSPTIATTEVGDKTGVNDTIQRSDGVFENDALIKVLSAAYLSAGAGSEILGDGITFPKRFTGTAPSSFTFVNHVLSNASAPFVDSFDQNYGIATRAASSAAGDAQYISTIDVS